MSVSNADMASPSSWAPAAQRHRVVDEARALLRLALPIMLIALVNMGMSLTDTLMVSALFGAEALAAVAIGSDLYSIIFYFGAGVLGGLAPFYTAAVVRADPLERLALVRIGMAAVALLGLLFVPLVWTAPHWLGHLGLESTLLRQGVGYTRAMALTLLPMLGVMLYRTVLTAAEKPQVFLRVTLAMLPLNAALNWVLMVGAGPVDALGPTGAGVSSLFVAVGTLLSLMWAARTGNRDASPASPRALVDWSGLVTVLRIGLPIGIATLAEVGVFLGATIYAATLGAIDVAAHTLTLRMAGVAYAVPAALLQASMVRMARAETLGDPGLRRAVTSSSLLLSLAFGIGLCGALVLAAAPLAHGVLGGNRTGELAAGLAVNLLVLLGIMECLLGPGSAAAGLLRGRKDTRVPMLYGLVGQWVVGVPVVIYLCEAHGLGINGVWIGLSAGTLVMTVLMLRRLRARA